MFGALTYLDSVAAWFAKAGSCRWPGCLLGRVAGGQTHLPIDWNRMAPRLREFAVEEWQ